MKLTSKDYVARANALANAADTFAGRSQGDPVDVKQAKWAMRWLNAHSDRCMVKARRLQREGK